MLDGSALSCFPSGSESAFARALFTGRLVPGSQGDTSLVLTYLPSPKEDEGAVFVCERWGYSPSY